MWSSHCPSLGLLSSPLLLPLLLSSLALLVSMKSPNILHFPSLHFCICCFPCLRCSAPSSNKRLLFLQVPDALSLPRKRLPKPCTPGLPSQWNPSAELGTLVPGALVRVSQLHQQLDVAMCLVNGMQVQMMCKTS